MLNLLVDKDTGCFSTRVCMARWALPVPLWSPFHTFAASYSSITHHHEHAAVKALSLGWLQYRSRSRRRSHWNGADLEPRHPWHVVRHSDLSPRCPTERTCSDRRLFARYPAVAETQRWMTPRTSSSASSQRPPRRSREGRYGFLVAYRGRKKASERCRWWTTSFCRYQ